MNFGANLQPVVRLERMELTKVIKQENDRSGDGKAQLDVTGFWCRLCRKPFKSASTLQRHWKSHYDVKCFACHLCDKTYTRSEHLRRHMRSHTGEKPYACGICNREFGNNSHLHQHIRTHTDERPYKCSICGSAFRQHSHLRDHKRQHSRDTNSAVTSAVGYHRNGYSVGNGRFYCTVCKKSFASKRSLKGHVRTVHTGETPYKCKVCGATFPERNRLLYHKKSHGTERKFECPECRKRYFFSWELKQHARYHVDEKPYVCSECEKQYHVSTHLKYHYLNHLGLQVPCDVCGFMSHTRWSFLAHLQLHLQRNGRKSAKVFYCSRCERRFSRASDVRNHFERTHKKKLNKKSRS